MRKTIKFILSTLILSSSLNLYSQTKDEAGVAYNEGIQFTKSEEYNKAIVSFEKAIDICTKVGTEADDLKAMAAEQLPSQYYKSATALYQEKKIDEAIKKYEKTVEIAKKYNNTEIEAKANDAIPQLYYLKGASSYKKDDFENALNYLNISIQRDPDFAKAYYLIGLVYNKMDDIAKMKESFDIAISKAEAEGDIKTASNSKKASLKLLTNYAIKAIQSENADDAIKYLDQAGEYGEGDANTYYYYALAYNKIKDWDKAIISANKALEIEKDEKDAKAKIYFELGTAYYGKGDTSEACKAYKDAAYGDYVAQANYQLKEVLKCQ